MALQRVPRSFRRSGILPRSRVARYCLEAGWCAGADDQAVFIAYILEAMRYAAVEAVRVAGGKCLHCVTYRYLESSLQDDAAFF